MNKCLNRPYLTTFVLLLFLLTAFCPAADKNKKAAKNKGAAKKKNIAVPISLPEYIGTLGLSDIAGKKYAAIFAQYEKAMSIYDSKQSAVTAKAGKATAGKATAGKATATATAKQREIKEWTYFARMLGLLTKDQKTPWHSPRMSAKLREMFASAGFKLESSQDAKIEDTVTGYLAKIQASKLNTNLSEDPMTMRALMTAFLSSIKGSLTEEQKAKLFGKPKKPEKNNRKKNVVRRNVLNKNGNIKTPSTPKVQTPQ